MNELTSSFFLVLERAQSEFETTTTKTTKTTTTMENNANANYLATLLCRLNSIFIQIALSYSVSNNHRVFGKISVKDRVLYFELSHIFVLFELKSPLIETESGAISLAIKYFLTKEPSHLIRSDPSSIA